jgi:methylglutamate dehydrogenase subunit A
MAVPAGVKYAVIGAGIHGLSTAYHLALKLKETGRGSGEDILVVDKTAIAAGASGIACGVVRNNYYQPAMRELMAQCVEVWESDPKAYSYHPVGYMQISPEPMHEQVATIYDQQKAIGYESVFVEGASDSETYMKGLFDDWQAKGITSVLHEKKGGYANNTASIYGLASKAEAEGVRIMTGVEVQGFEFGGNSNAVTALITDKGRIGCDYVVVGVGPWVNRSGTCWTCRAPSRSGRPTARCARACACGNTGAWRRARWASTPTCTRPMTGACRPCCMSTPTRRSIPTSTVR